MGAYAHGQGVIELPLLDFAPDLAYDATTMGIGGVTLIDMDNASPTVKGYQALNSLQPFSEAPSPAVGTPAPETVLGSTVAYFSDGYGKIFFGGTDHLYRFDGNAWVQVSPQITVGPNNNRWRFTQWGDDVIAVNAGGGWERGGKGNPVDPIIKPQVTNGPSGTFLPLLGDIGDPPVNVTTACAVNGQVLMFWGSNWTASGLDSDTIWTPDVQTQSNQSTLYDFPGNIVAAAPLFRNVVAFKETAIWLGTYTGGYAVWSWQLLSDLTGTWCQEAVIELPDMLAFVGADDFYTCSGYTPQRIPNSLKEWFFDIADPKAFHQLLSRYDATHAVCYWYFVSKTPVIHNVPDRWVAWNSRTGRWGSGYVGQNGAFSVPFPNQQPGLLTGLIFTADQVLRSWTGAPGGMRLSTGYFGTATNLSQCMRMRPIYHTTPDSSTLNAWYVRNLGEHDINGGTTWLNERDGWFYFRQYDRWHRFVLNTVGPNVQPTQVSQTGAEISAFAVEMRQGGWR